MSRQLIVDDHRRQCCSPTDGADEPARIESAGRCRLSDHRHLLDPVCARCAADRLAVASATKDDMISVAHGDDALVEVPEGDSSLLAIPRRSVSRPEQQRGLALGLQEHALIGEAQCPLGASGVRPSLGSNDREGTQGSAEGPVEGEPITTLGAADEPRGTKPWPTTMCPISLVRSSP
jgi:hypothetical protein